jgi:2-haloacid dehalogenase
MATTTSAIKPLIVFDVNETLLDLDTMRSIFERLFGDRNAMRTWFDNLIVYSEALTLANCYVPFTDIGAAVLQMLAKARGVTITDADKRELTDNFASMPPHPEVPEALKQLRVAGFRLFTLTDNLLEIQGRQLEHGGIIGNFERRFSVDQEVHRHKPAPEAYGYVERQLGVKPSDLLLIACHTWDTIGALGAGWHAALIKRPPNEVLGVGPQPEITGSDLRDVAAQLIARYGSVRDTAAVP